MGDLFQRAIRLCVCLCSVRLMRDQTKGRPPLVPLGLGDLCTCTSQLQFLLANTASYLTDGDVSYGGAEADLGSSAKEVLRSAGIKVEIRSPNTPAQLGGAERAGAIIVIAARVLRIYSGLPKTLANELVCTAARLLNLTPTRSIDWRIPHEMVTGVCPDLSRLHAIGSRGFVLDKHLPRGDKLKDCTFEGFLLGYNASNIY
jgi:hypothetical protein